MIKAMPASFCDSTLGEGGSMGGGGLVHSKQLKV